MAVSAAAGVVSAGLVLVIISHKHRFIFLKTKKTAGTSMEAALSAICGPQDVITPFRSKSEKHREGRAPQNYRLDHPLVPKRPLWRRLLRRPERYYHPTIGYYEHMLACSVKAYIGEEIWDSYFKFAFDRNPWDRQVSWYRYKTMSKEPRPTFDEFMSNPKRAYVENFDIYSIDDQVAMDFVGRFENVEEDFREALKLAGIAEDVTLREVNVGNKGDIDYRTYYSEHTLALISQWYARDLDRHTYNF